MENDEFKPERLDSNSASPAANGSTAHGNDKSGMANGGISANGHTRNGILVTKPAPVRQARRAQHPDLREARTNPAEVLVLAFGSHAFRYGRASDTTPRKVLSLVAFPRRSNASGDKSLARPVWASKDIAVTEADVAEFEREKLKVTEELDLNSRRIGGGKPIPWDVEVEVVSARTKDSSKEMLEEKGHRNVRIGRDAEVLLRDKNAAEMYDIVAPMWDGKFVFGVSNTTDGLVRAALDELLRYVACELGIGPGRDAKEEINASNGDCPNATNGVAENPEGEEKEESEESIETEKEKEALEREKYAHRQVAIVVPDASDRRDVAEIVDAIFRVDELRAGAVYVHQSSVSCALGAGLATCAVIDIGHSATTVACVEEGSICGDSRVHLDYGAYHMRAVFLQLLRGSTSFMQAMGNVFAADGVEDEQRNEHDLAAIASRALEQICGFRSDDNDRLLIASVAAPAGDVLRVKIGLGARAVPAYGLTRPALLLAGTKAAGSTVSVRKREKYERNSDDDNFLDDLYAEMRRSATATAALPIGRFANEADETAATTGNGEADAGSQSEALGTDANIVDAVIWAIGRAVRASAMVAQQPGRAPELHRRFLNAIVLSGGGASLDGIALALESKIKQGLSEKGMVVSDVTVIDGGKGKGDEELVAATAVLRDQKGAGATGQGDDTDTASLPWKGCAVMVEADAVKDYWVYKEEWDDRNVRALRERVPFYW